MAEQVETIIVGGGQSGLAMSHWLRHEGREHLILEQHGIADRWQSQRWDSLCLLTPNWTVTLPSYQYDGPDPNGFMGKDELHGILTAYAERIAAPAHVPPAWPDPPELTDPILQLDLRAAGVTSIIWATGFRYAFDWIRLPVLDAEGNPRHQRGITEFPGLYFLGLRWLYKFKSSFIHGVGDDAEYLAEHITATAR